MRYSQRFLGSTQRCFAVHLYLLGLKGKAYLLYSSSLCSSSRFVDVLIPLDLLRSSAAAESIRGYFPLSRTRQQFEGIGIFDSTAQGRDSSNQHFRGKTNLCWTYLRWTLQGTAPRMQRIQCSRQFQSAQTGPPDQALGQAWPQQCKQGNQAL